VSAPARRYAGGRILMLLSQGTRGLTCTRVDPHGLLEGDVAVLVFLPVVPAVGAVVTFLRGKADLNMCVIWVCTHDDQVPFLVFVPASWLDVWLGYHLPDCGQVLLLSHLIELLIHVGDLAVELFEALERHEVRGAAGGGGEGENGGGEDLREHGSSCGDARFDPAFLDKKFLLKKSGSKVSQHSIKMVLCQCNEEKRVALHFFPYFC